MKPINFIKQDEDVKAKELLTWLWAINGDYEKDAKPRFTELGYFVPEEQYKAYMRVINLQYELDSFGWG